MQTTLPLAFTFTRISESHHKLVNLSILHRLFGSIQCGNLSGLNSHAYKGTDLRTNPLNGLIERPPKNVKKAEISTPLAPAAFDSGRSPALGPAPPSRRAQRKTQTTGTKDKHLVMQQTHTEKFYRHAHALIPPSVRPGRRRALLKPSLYIGETIKGDEARRGAAITRRASPAAPSPTAL